MWDRLRGPKDFPTLYSQKFIIIRDDESVGIMKIILVVIKQIRNYQSVRSKGESYRIYVKALYVSKLICCE